MNYNSVYINDLTRSQKACPNIDRINGSSILITGATGLVCSAIVDFLLNLNDTVNAGITVYVAARNRDRTEQRFGDRVNRADVVYVKYDALRDIDWNFKVDYIIHGASPANPALYVKQPVETMLTNILGTNNILRYAKNQNTKRVLFVSSSEVYGRKNTSEPYGDSEYGYVDILNPRACYPCAKRACETLCTSYEVEYGVDSVMVRLGHIYGPTATREDTRASSQFFYDVIDGHNIIMKSSGTQVRSYCYVVDCVSAIMTALINGVSGSAYNVSNPLSVMTIRELAEIIAESAEMKVVFEKPSDMERRGYNLMDNSSLDSTSLSKLGWTPIFGKTDGILHTYMIMRGC
jgi:nucleoside-diphosphate-sugar epimerase